MLRLFDPSGASPSSSSRANRSLLQEPFWETPEQDSTPNAPSGGPALAPLASQSSSILSQQPLPPLRFLNSHFSPPPVPASAQPTQDEGQFQYEFRDEEEDQERYRSSRQDPSAYSRSAPAPAAFPRSAYAHERERETQLPLGYRYTRRARSTLSAVISSLDEIGHDLEYANSHLQALLDLPAPNDPLNPLPPLLSASFSTTTNMTSRPGGPAGPSSRRDSSRSEDAGRLSKRRKIDGEKAAPPPYKAIQYGRYGQVEPGALTMEIVSCDGGLYSDGSSYAAENILKNDNTVYCTKGNRCNIVLQHQGCTTFSLKELIIKAPGRNYSSPVKEGMVFLSMSKDELLRTEQYQSNILPAPTSLFQHVENLRARVARAERLVGLHSRDENDNTGSLDDGRPFEEDIYNADMETSTDVPADPLADGAATSQPTFRVLTECSDDEDEQVPGRLGRERYGQGSSWRSNNVGWSPTPLRNRTRRRLPVYDETSPLGAHLTWDVDRTYDDEDEDDYTELYDLGNATISSPDSPRDDGIHVNTRPRERDRREIAHNRSGNRSRDEDEPSPFRGSLFFESRRNSAALALRNESTPAHFLPHAEFHIEMNKNKCTILFDPPVTARYILLKMWNPRQEEMGGNIDIQGVVAKGYAGPRYFPAMELR